MGFTVYYRSAGPVDPARAKAISRARRVFLRAIPAHPANTAASAACGMCLNRVDLYGTAGADAYLHSSYDASGDEIWPVQTPCFSENPSGRIS
jgi:hypothetical protein